ncbi:hypothetical protein QN277_001490 [Acacia crassicarpa]|uniref:DUF7086 domain-containing protein n=1 Tax=Acacia crassicarpa TaxID=499986 RepID=A0AAE1N8J8_9FABA|nr:hypothetical protein QN277_001490 [Acacia crassicarpa]
MDKGKSKAFEEQDSDFLKLNLNLFSSSPSSSSSSNPDFQYSHPMQNLASPDTIFSPSSSSTPALSPITQPLLNQNPSQRAVLSPQPPIIPQNPNHVPLPAQRSETIPVPFPWATDRRAKLKSLRWLGDNQILTITGTVQCRTCDMSYEIGFNLVSKFVEVFNYIARNDDNLYDRAPVVWMTPRLPICKNCGISVRPVISEHKRSINWLFLFLGQMLGCCTLEQLKYYCKHTGRFRTGAKDRILYNTYLGICKRLLELDDLDN